MADGCMGKWSQRLSAERGYAVNQTFDFAPGDGVAFHGWTFHATSDRPPNSSQRQALALRFAAATARYEHRRLFMGQNLPFWSYLPPDCAPLAGPLFPIVYPRGRFAEDSPIWPLPLVGGDVE